MRTVNMHQAKTHLSRLVGEAVDGEPFVIARAGKPLVRVTALDAKSPAKKSRLGFLDGQFEVPEDFDTMLADEIQAMFEGKYKGVLEQEYREPEEG
ncbi:MAG: type II toxin-antitoxin system prevent-host-death family antitoxin [Gammaproteobacteria bacterium]|nr:type II toxin-antitoxin system prevent-host-death family antitoxin [Gammaproteobacteria bacterium]